ncbi:hypothetical protein GCM10023169_34320 [Georgenia halophila]|uniref:Gfo/Idh/MocA-like oxidoreductase N-terminal domain-containing protein n=1 Tax=Georgenia halophila TaxID=620889 RepID=A0ABP8LLP6_9MICO
MHRIGFIGTENSHTDHFIRFLNTEGRHPGLRAAALAGGRNQRNETLAQQGDVGLVVDRPEDLLGQVDAAIISSRDGARHRGEAEPLLRAGMPVLVDKPLATSVRDAEAILAAAQEGGAPLVSASALRFVPEVAELADPQDRGDLRALHIVGPADPDSEYSGLFFYGVHHVETALELLGNPAVEPGSVTVTARRDGDTVTALLRIGHVDVHLTFITPDGDTRVPFFALAVGTSGVVARELTLGPDYNAPALERFAVAVESGTTPMDAAQLLSPVVVMTAITEALGKDHR